MKLFLVVPWVVNFVEDRWFPNFLSEDVDVHDVGADVLRHELDVENAVVIRQAGKLYKNTLWKGNNSLL